MDGSEDTLRGLAMHDEHALTATLASRPDAADMLAIDARTCALLRLAAYVALDAPVVCYQSAVALALASGGTVDDIVDTLRAIAPVVGTARVVAAAPALALAIGYDIDAALEAYDGAPAWGPTP